MTICDIFDLFCHSGAAFPCGKIRVGGAPGHDRIRDFVAQKSISGIQGTIPKGCRRTSYCDNLHVRPRKCADRIRLPREGTVSRKCRLAISKSCSSDRRKLKAPMNLDHERPMLISKHLRCRKARAVSNFVVRAESWCDTIAGRRLAAMAGSKP